MTFLPLLVALLAGQTCSPATTPRPPTIAVYGDSRMQGGLCSSSSPASPAAYVDANLPGGASYGWLVKNAGVTGYTPAQILAAYNSGEATLCNGERCAYLVVNGGVNCLRLGTAPATCLADMITLVDDALAKGYAVVWMGETDYSLWASAGSNPTTQATTFNTLWTAACAARASNTRLKCLDLYTSMGVPLTNTCDGVHDNQTGTNLRGSLILTALQSIP